MLRSKISFLSRITLLLLLFMPVKEASGQSWLPGYNYRKKITINKPLVAGSVNLTDFPLLISLEDPELSYVAGRCSGNNLSGTKGLDFAFTLVTTPAVPLNFQLDNYEPASGKLVSWVKIPSLTASGSSAAATEIYLYYGANTIHFPLEPEARATWRTEVNRVWHMNAEGPDLSNLNFKINTHGERLAGQNLRAESYTPGKIGQAVTLNGQNQYLTSVKDNNANFFVTCWMKLGVINREQVLISADSVGFGGFVIKISNQNQLTLITRINSVVTEKTASLKLVANQWYHIAVVYHSGRRGFYINGTYYDTGFVVSASKSGGQIYVGSDKQRQLLFNGTIDELQIQSVGTTDDWVKTAYRNQDNPSAFYAVSAQQRSVTIVPTGMVFSGKISDRWLDSGNWNTKEVPGNLEQIIVAKGAKLDIDATADLVFNKLDVEADAVVTIHRKVEVLCQSTVVIASKLVLSSNASLQLDGQVLNDGLISAIESTASVTFSGANSLQLISGKGSMDLYALYIDQSAKGNTSRLEQPVQVHGYVSAVTGLLDANSFLALKYSGGRTAFVWPIADVSEAGILGEVLVEQFVPGSYPEPATARGWRLLSPPVYHGSGSGKAYYHLYDYKASIFVTGPGGTVNGFDNSAQNGHTIYTHNQATVGNLSQKYLGIPAMNTSVFVGKGIYVYSRGGRNAADAFVKQIQVAPFQNPEGYMISHKGLLFQGTLEVETQNRNMGESGDGFNLLGNPYAAPLRWGNVQKEQMGPYLWKFNSLNNAYDVSDDPNTLISAGEGFFVKVLNGYGTGKVVFTESAKLTTVDMVSQSPVSAVETRALLSARSNERNPGDKQRSTSSLISKLNLRLSRDVFQQQYTLIFSAAGNDDLDDQDATALGTGYVGIAGLASGGSKLSVDSRALPGRRPLEIPFYVRGWATGSYHLSIDGIASLPSGYRLLLVDRYLNNKTEIKYDQVYNIEINNALPNSFGEQRFVLQIQNISALEAPEQVNVIEEDKVRTYPNPFSESLKLKLPEDVMMKLGVRIRDLMGQVIFRADLGLVSGQQPATIETGAIAVGTYLMEIINLENNQRVKSVKIIKE